MEFVPQESIDFIIRQAFGKLKNRIHNKLREKGLNITMEQGGILMQLFRKDGSSQVELTCDLEKDKTTIARIISNMEMDLCGHATLASAHVLFEELGFSGHEIKFKTQSGNLIVKKTNDLLELDFPSRPPVKSELPEIISKGLNMQPKEIWKARDYLLVYDNEDDIKKIEANAEILNQINIDPGGIIVTARGKKDNIDFVSRLFTPQATIFEDPVTGSAHCTLIPFWSQRLNKTELRALQLSNRGGELYCKLIKDRVKISGKAVTYLQGTIEI